MHDTPLILIFVKVPIKGQVKSRLAVCIGEEATVALYKNFIHDIVGTVEKSTYPLKICFYPADKRVAVASLLGSGYDLMPQQSGDLGTKMEHAFRQTFVDGFTSVLLIGSDIPDIPTSIFREALDSLKNNDVVIGPAADGGYYLIGFNNDSFLPQVFYGIPWGTDMVFRMTMGILDSASLRIHLVASWWDVDTFDDLVSLFHRNKDTVFSRSKTMTYLLKTRLCE